MLYQCYSNQKNLYILLPLGTMMRGGLSDGGVPGVIFSNGKTWTEARRTSLHILKNFGMGKNRLEEIVDEEVSNLIEHIDDQRINIPLGTQSFASLMADQHQDFIRCLN